MPAGTAIMVRMHPLELSKLDRFRRQRENPPTRGQAMRELAAIGFSVIESEGSTIAAAQSGLNESAHDE
jgi:hypothetical protein